MQMEHISRLSPNVSDACSPVSVVIVTYNSALVLPGLLDSIAAGLAKVDDFDVVIVDNASEDSSVELALAHPVKPNVIKMMHNAGYAAGINAAAKVIATNRDI
jgi:N-acetylglucosaminyl-diphospho-decaprenol L-rhamnosyltransferase